ncbi:uncharacterized protein MONBRDRAFT_13031 [Monosiga brevicollis MX1]|uniref:USP domain-containing protein n=1 Tax=Monosiga brevicollis TaxID=81824 RepID=A9VE52_MONBE|nr:uncharacterized protein MONBRDRAFT_13031 [Monosiga brevicollis MX1]EDQ84188.1 predicted protein [Monosiga brevicollis MX1]|eukprot:XP_001750976.1 hypothetical protein [Monosiga brevicollis MX1]
MSRVGLDNLAGSQSCYVNAMVQVVCPCGAQSSPTPYHAGMLTVLAASVMDEFRQDRTRRFGVALKRSMIQDGHLACGYTHCTASPSRRHQATTLRAAPPFLNLALTWSEAAASSQDLDLLLSSIDFRLYPSDLFDHVELGGTATQPIAYELTGLLVYGSSHHLAIVRGKQDVWWLCDDHRTQHLGFWPEVKSFIESRHYQPILLTYARVDNLPPDQDGAIRSESNPLQQKANLAISASADDLGHVLRFMSHNPQEAPLAHASRPTFPANSNPRPAGPPSYATPLTQSANQHHYPPPMPNTTTSAMPLPPEGYSPLASNHTHGYIPPHAPVHHHQYHGPGPVPSRPPAQSLDRPFDNAPADHSYPPQAHTPQAYPPQAYPYNPPQTHPHDPPQAYPYNPPQAYPPQAHPSQAHSPQAYPPQAYPPQAYPSQAYPSQAHPPQAYPPQAPSPHGRPWSQQP